MDSRAEVLWGCCRCPHRLCRHRCRHLLRWRPRLRRQRHLGRRLSRRRCCCCCRRRLCCHCRCHRQPGASDSDRWSVIGQSNASENAPPIPAAGGKEKKEGHPSRKMVAVGTVSRLKSVGVATLSFSSPYYESIVCLPQGAPKGAPAWNIIILPGNPGQPGFYRKFVEELVPILPEARWRISICGLRGHVSHATRAKVRATLPKASAPSSLIAPSSNTRRPGQNSFEGHFLIMVWGHNWTMWLSTSPQRAPAESRGRKRLWCEDHAPSLK